MLEESIKYIKQELDKHEIMKHNLLNFTRTNAVEKAITKYDKDINKLRFILKILKEQKK